MTRTPYSLEHLCDIDLLAELTKLARSEHQLSALMLAHLAEVDARRLYATRAAPSLFAYCTRELHFSEDAAYKRIQAARAARRFPLIFELVAAGELHLAAVSLLAPRLTENNHVELCQAARHKSKREVEELLAARFALPDAPTRLRKLPQCEPRLLAAPSAPLAPAEHASAVGTHGAPPGAAPGPSEPSPSPAPLAPPATTSPALSLTGVRPPAAARALVTPLSSERFRLQLTLSRATRDKLVRAQELLGHKQPDGDLAAVLDAALSLLCTTLEAKKFGKKTKTERAGQPVATQGARPAPVTTSTHALATAAAPAQAVTCTAARVPTAPAPGQAVCAAPASAKVHASVGGRAPAPKPTTGEHGRAGHRSRYLPRAVRRAVAERDGYRCTFVAADGNRCPATGRLEYHHVEPFARGGPATSDNLTLRCPAHNLRQAELDFGRLHVHTAIAARSCRPSGAAS